MNAPRNDGRDGLRRKLPSFRPLRIAALVGFGMLVSVVLPFVFSSWPLFLVLVVLLTMGAGIMLALNIYKAFRR